MSSEKYNSIFGDKQITGSQYIAELCIFRHASKKRVTLPSHFWKNKDFQFWKAEFLKQKRKADAYLRVGYTPKAILIVLNSTKFKSCYSLYNPRLEFAIHEAQRQINNSQQIVNESETDIQPKSDTTQFRPSFGTNKSKINKLRD